MKKTQKTKFTALLLVLLTLFSALFIPINAAEPEMSEDMGIEEIMPMAANSCGQWIDGTYYPGLFLGEANGKYEYLNEKNEQYIIYYDSNGFAEYSVHYSDHGNPKHHSNPHYHSFSSVEDCWTQNKASTPGTPF